MSYNNYFCSLCKEYNCRKHTVPKGTITERLTKLIGHFESPEEEMRTYISPEKHSSAALPGNDNSQALQTLQLAHSSNYHRNMLHPTIMDKPPTTTSMVRVSEQKSSNDFENRSKQTKDNDLISLKEGYKEHHFAGINACSFVSCSSPTGIYSELSLTLWLDNKTYAKYASSVDKYRAIINLMYDAEDDIWCVSGKLLKRQTYYIKDDDEMLVQNRLCLVSELRSEIKRILLYLGISPREAYRCFRRAMRQSTVTTKTDYGFITVESKSHSVLSKELDKSVNHHWNEDNYYSQNAYSRQGHYPSDRSRVTSKVIDSSMYGVGSDE